MEEKLVNIDVLVEDSVKFCKSNMLVAVSGGHTKAGIEQALQSVLSSVYSIMNATGQKKMIISINDETSKLQIGKKLSIKIINLPDGENKLDEEGTIPVVDS
jgi:hypothetical protein